MLISSVWCISLYFAALEPGPGQAPVASPTQAVFDQIFAANRAVKTIEFSFEVTENRLIKRGGRPPKVIHWQGKFRADLPNRYRIEYHEDGQEEQVTAGIDGDGCYRALTWIANQRVNEGSVGPAYGAELADGPCLNSFFGNYRLGLLERPRFPYWPERADLSNFTVKRVDELYVLEGVVPPETDWQRLTVDPRRGYSIVRTETALKPGGMIWSTTDIEYAEIVPGIWVAHRGTREDRTDAGAIMTEMEFKVVPETMRLNLPLDPTAMDVEFPNGTRVTDLVAKRSYFVGGDSRDSRTVEELAAQMDELRKSTPGTPDLAMGGLSAAPTFWQRSSTIVIPVALAAIVVGLLLYRRSMRNQ